LYGGAIKSFYSKSIDELNTYVTNFGGEVMGFVPGPNATFLRFLENHDEERIAYAYGSYEKTMPMSTVVFTVPGIPMIYSGQEVGFGLGVAGDLDSRRRGVLNWNSGGEPLLLPHYQRLSHIRSQYAAFSTQQFVRISSNNSQVYAYTRPLNGADGIVAVNFSSAPEDISLSLTAPALATAFQSGTTYYANDLYNDTSYTVIWSGGYMTLALRLEPYGSAVIVLSDSIKHLSLPDLVSIPVWVNRHEALEAGEVSFQLHQNYPNPLSTADRSSGGESSATIISYQVPRAARISLKVFNILGEEIAVLADQWQDRGTYAVRWNGVRQGGNACSSGVYFVRMQAEGFSAVRKLIIVR
jgi:hypothetical protein